MAEMYPQEQAIPCRRCPAAILSLLLIPLAPIAMADAPALNPALIGPNRILNDVHFQLVPAQYVTLPDSITAGAWVYRLLLKDASAATLETVQMGDAMSDARLVGAWSGSYGDFRFTLQPTASPPSNQTAGFVMRPPGTATRMDLVATDLRQFGSQYPHTVLTLRANGIDQGTVTMHAGSQVTYTYSLALKDRVSFQLTGAGSADVTAIYMYGPASSAQPIKSVEGICVRVTGGGAAVTHDSAYAGPANALGLRVEASGVNAGSTLIVRNALGSVIGQFSLTSGASVLTTEDSDALRRNCDVRMAYPVGQAPSPSTSRVLWAHDMCFWPVTWNGPASPAKVSSAGDTVVMEGPNTGSAVYYCKLNLPTQVTFDDFPYLTVRMRASLHSLYYIRPQGGSASASVTTSVIGLEQRRGQGTDGSSGWETVTFNLRSLQRIYRPPATMMDNMYLVVGSEGDYSPQPGEQLKLEIDWMAVHRGVAPESPVAEENNFCNNLDDDDDGLTDRDDPYFRVLNPVSVYTNYQSVVRSMTEGGFKGQRLPGPGQSGSAIDIDPARFSPGNPTKRLVCTTYYPLDYIRNPNYEAPANYNEFFDENSSGIWKPCATAYLPPTEQFPSLDYGVLGGLEEYNIKSYTWVQAQADVARRHGLDGFIYNDGALTETSGSYLTYAKMVQALNDGYAGAWRSRPMGIASFFSPITIPGTPHTTSTVVTSFGFIGMRKAVAADTQVRRQGKPVIFMYPKGAPFGLADYEQVFQGLANLAGWNYEGALDSARATVGDANALTLNFDRWLTGGYCGALESITWLDKDMRAVGVVKVGTPEARATLLLDGWGADVPADSVIEQPYTQIAQNDAHGQLGVAHLRLSIPRQAEYMDLHMQAWGADGGVQQYCEMRINRDGGQSDLRFPTKLNFAHYLFRLRNLPAGFDAHGVSPAPASELPFSLWGDVASLVRRMDDPNVLRGFDGYAAYSPGVRDMRIEVSYPYLTAGTVIPGYDDSGVVYYCSGTRPYYGPRYGGMTYRIRWEELIAKGADMAIVTSWNEFCEGTNIEPDIEHGFNPLRLTLTYSLIYQGLIETGVLPSISGFLVRRFDREGTTRQIHFSLTGPDTVCIRNTHFGTGGHHITSITRNGAAVTPGSAEARLDSATDFPCLALAVPPGSASYIISYRVPEHFVPDGVDAFAADVANPERGGLTNWTPMGENNPPRAFMDYDAANQALRVQVSAVTDGSARISGWTSGNSEWLPYDCVGSSNYVRAKFFVFRQSQANPYDVNQVPNMRLRVSTRFAVNSMLEVFCHSNLDPGITPQSSELCPSSNPALPSMYRVDFAPVDVPALYVAGEGVGRGFEVYALENQENGALELTESVIGTYPASVTPNSVAPAKTYAVSASDAGDLKIMNSVTDLAIRKLFSGSLADDPAPGGMPTYLEGPGGVTLDSTGVATDRVGIVSREFYAGAALTSRVRVEPGRQYKIRWHVTSTRASNRQAQMRLRARSIKFMWSQKYEIGGAYAAGSMNNAIAQQALPGSGCMNPDRTASESGGWYTMLMHTPMSPDIRPTQPNLAAQPGPGANSASVRDVNLGMDLIDTLSGSSSRALEAGLFTLDRVEVRSYSLVDD